MPARLGTAKFCSYACRGKWRAQHWSGPNNPQYQAGPRELICQHCGQRFSQRGTEAISEFASGSSARWNAPSTGKSGSMVKRIPSTRWTADVKTDAASTGHGREPVISRDNATCQKCGAQNVELHAHHIRSFADHPELRWDVSNGQTLCFRCHWEEHSTHGFEASTEDNREPSEGVTASGRAFRRWLGHCAECGAFISKPFGQVIGKSAVFCNRACRGKWTSRNMKGKSRNLPFPDGRAR